MKKFTTIILAAALIVAAAGQVSASTLETSGEFRARYWYANNWSYVDRQATDDSVEWWDQRLRLNTTWKVTDTVKVITRADILENYWQTGQPPLWGNSDGDVLANTNPGSVSNNEEIDFDWAYAMFNVGDVTASLGKMDVSWGSGIYAQADNRYRIKLTTKFDKVGVGAAWDKMAETFNSGIKDDDNAVSVWATFPIADWNFGVLGGYRKNGYIDSNIPNTNNYSIDFFVGDLFAKGAIGPVKLNAEVAFASGTREQPDSAGGDIDLSGLIGYAGAFMPVGPVNIGLEFAYSQGDDADTKDENEGLLFHDYQGAFNSFILFTPFDFGGWANNYTADAGPNNVIAAKGSVTYPVTKEFTLMGAVVWAEADQQRDRADKDMGIEIDGLARYALSENVTLQAGAGYLSAGDFFRTKSKTMEPNNPIVVTAHAIVTF